MSESSLSRRVWGQGRGGRAHPKIGQVRPTPWRYRRACPKLGKVLPRKVCREGLVPGPVPRPERKASGCACVHSHASLFMATLVLNAQEVAWMLERGKKRCLEIQKFKTVVQQNKLGDILRKFVNFSQSTAFRVRLWMTAHSGAHYSSETPDYCHPSQTV